MHQAAQSFLLGFPALFSIINPLSAALIFWELTNGFPAAERARLAARVALYALLVMLSALWAGGYVLAFFGISVAALRVAGGLVVATRAWSLLGSPERHEHRKRAQAETERSMDEIAFFPLTLPITTGPGTISVAITLAAGYEPGRQGFWSYHGGLTAAAAAMALVILASLRSADLLASRMGATGRRTVTRLAAFLLLCIGVQVAMSGVADVLRPLLAARGA